MSTDVKTQLWGLFGTAVVFLLGRAWAYVAGNASQTTRDQVATWEGYARTAVGWAKMLWPSLAPEVLATKALDRLRTMLDGTGYAPTPDQWAHLQTVIDGEILAWELGKLGAAATGVKAAIAPVLVARPGPLPLAPAP